MSIFKKYQFPMGKVKIINSCLIKRYHIVSIPDGKGKGSKKW